MSQVLRVEKVQSARRTMLTSSVSKKTSRAAPKVRQHVGSKSSISSTSSSDEELLIRRKNLPGGKVEPDSHSTDRARHRRPSSRSSVEKHGRRCHPHPSPHHYHVQQTYSLDRSHPHGQAGVWCPQPAWPASPSPWLYPTPPEMYPAVQPQQQRGPCCCCHTPPVSLCQVGGR